MGTNAEHFSDEGMMLTRYGSHWSSKATMSQQCHAVARKTTHPSTHEGWSPDNIWRNPSTLISTGYTSFGLLHIIFEYQISRKVSPSWREARGELRHHHNPTIFFLMWAIYLEIYHTTFAKYWYFYLCHLFFCMHSNVLIWLHNSFSYYCTRNELDYRRSRTMQKGKLNSYRPVPFTTKSEIYSTWGKESNVYMKKENNCCFGDLSSGHVIEKLLYSDIPQVIIMFLISPVFN